MSMVKFLNIKTRIFKTHIYYGNLMHIKYRPITNLVRNMVKYGDSLKLDIAESMVLQMYNQCLLMIFLRRTSKTNPQMVQLSSYHNNEVVMLVLDTQRGRESTLLENYEVAHFRYYLTPTLYLMSFYIRG